MNILSSIPSFLTLHFPPVQKTSETDSSKTFPVESPQKIDRKISQSQPDFQVPVDLDPQNLYHPRFLPDFASDNFNYLSSHPAIKPRLN
ncbi:hypothetical protein ACL6C3_06065 [Capilliphycus salinus ALCB114379]|uniref:hypothetical protein n=1 Tax=Capilliphycus salinus TaxID=2768948 RepID=UPI0039A40738